MIINLLKAESIKLINSSNLKVLLSLHLIFFALLMLVTARLDISFPGFTTENLLRFPWIWNVSAYYASWFNILLALLVIMMTCNEYTYKTFRQNLIDGLSRDELFAGKGAFILILALYATMVVVLAALIPGVITTRGTSLSSMFSHAYLAGVFFIQAIGYMTLAFLIANLLRNTALSIIAFLFLRLIAEPIIRLLFNPQIRQFFPFRVITRLTPTPGLQAISDPADITSRLIQESVDLSETGLVAPAIPLHTSILVALGYIILFAMASWLIMRRRDF